MTGQITLSVLPFGNIPFWIWEIIYTYRAKKAARNLV
jgi:hypothetical protein